MKYAPLRVDLRWATLAFMARATTAMLDMLRKQKKLSIQIRADERRIKSERRTEGREHGLSRDGECSSCEGHSGGRVGVIRVIPKSASSVIQTRGRPVPDSGTGFLFVEKIHVTNGRFLLFFFWNETNAPQTEDRQMRYLIPLLFAFAWISTTDAQPTKPSGGLEGRVGRLEGIVEQIDKRLTNIEHDQRETLKRVEAMSREINIMRGNEWHEKRVVERN